MKKEFIGKSAPGLFSKVFGPFAERIDHALESKDRLLKRFFDWAVPEEDKPVRRGPGVDGKGNHYVDTARGRLAD